MNFSCRSMPATIIFLLINCLFLSELCYSDINSINDAINKAGRQRMLSQRMVKDYLMIGHEIQSQKAQKDLDLSIALYQQQHIELLNYSPSREIAAKLVAVNQLWSDFRLKVLAQPQPLPAMQLIRSAENLLAANHQVVQALEQYSQRHSARWVNISGRQRMLSQKLAMLYIAMSWRLPMAALEQDFLSTLKDYQEGLHILLEAKINTAEINSLLKKVQAQWQFSQAGFSQYDNGRFVPTVISATSESMLNKMDEITLLYEQLESAKGA